MALAVKGLGLHHVPGHYSPSGFRGARGSRAPGRVHAPGGKVRRKVAGGGFTPQGGGGSAMAGPVAAEDRRRGRGQSLVEFALVLPILLLTLLIALDFGRAFFAWVGITSASRAGAAYAASNPGAGWATTPDPVIVARYRSQITSDLLPTNCVMPSPIPLPSLSGTGLGGHVTVTLTCTFNVITPLVASIVGTDVPITATTVYPVRAGEIAGGPVLNHLPGPTPTPSPSPEPTAGPTPSPSPKACYAPQMTGLTVADARAAWIDAGFTGQFKTVPGNGQDGWIVTAQVPTHPSSALDCGDNTKATVTAPAP